MQKKVDKGGFLVHTICMIKVEKSIVLDDLRVKVGSSIRVGLVWLMVEDIEDNLVYCIDQDGQEMCVSVHRVDAVL